jgi:hypothetical protein
MARESVPGWLAALAAPGSGEAGADPSPNHAERPGELGRALPRASDVVEAAIAGMSARDPGPPRRGSR